MLALGIDIGGTFTDLVLLDTASGELHTHKLLTTPDDPVRAVLDGARALCAEAGDRRPDRVVHGTTLITNAVVERRGAITALLTTRGFRDVLEIRREGRYDLYDLDLEFPEPLAPRRRRFEATERLDETGAVVEPLDLPALDALLKSVRTGPEPISAWAVTFLHAYANPAHELKAAERIRSAFPEASISLSSEVAPEVREYERTSTTVANAYVQPVAEGYLRRLGDGLEASLPAGASPVSLHILLSDGALTTPEVAAAFPIRIVESGPAGGVLAASRVAAGRGESSVLSLDMGGTTAKIAFLDEHGPRTRSTFEMDRRGLFRKGSGIPVLVPAMDLVEIGAGGGSIAHPNAMGILQIGPESSGADPGPACYGRGGTRATVTDADVVLGLLDPDYFLGGAMSLDADAARRAVERDVATPLGLEILEAAHGIHRLVGSNMAEATRVHAAERGIDPSTHTLVAFGGAGPVHAWSVAHQLGIRRVLFPSYAGVQSALGFLAAPPAFEVSRSWTAEVNGLDVAQARALLAELEEQARGVVESAGSGTVSAHAFVDMRYRGQGAEIRVPFAPADLSVEALAARFAETYADLYGRSVEGIPVETVTWRVRCERPAPPVPVFDGASAKVDAVPVPRPGKRTTAWLPDAEAPREVPVYRREQLTPGVFLQGPALIQEPESTLVLGTGTARVLVGGAIEAKLTRRA